MLLKQAAPKGHFEAAEAGSGPGLCEPSSWVARPGTAERSRAVAARRASAPSGSGGAAVFYIHPTTYLERDRWNAPLARRRRHRVPHPPLRPEPGERVQRRGRDLGAALPPGGVRRVPARQRGRAEARSTSPIATSRAAFDQFVEGSRRPADHPRRPQPGRAPPRAAAARKGRRQADREAHRRGLCGRLADRARPPTCPRSASRPALAPTRPAASCRG